LQTIQALEKGQRKNYIQQVQFFLLALKNMARALRNVPGYKHIVLFSAGIARQVLFGRTGGVEVGGWATPEQFAAQLNEYDANRADTELASNFSNLIDELKASNCALYTIDISKVPRAADVSDLQGETPVSREMEGSDSLRILAAQTGGRYYASTVDPEEAMSEISDLTRSYYVLGFKVDERWDGKFHKIKVKLNKKGYNLYAQGGYFNPKPFKEYSGFERMLHLIELALADEPQPFIPVEIPVVSLSLTESGKTSVLAFARADGESLAEVFGPKTEAYLLLFNERSEIEFIKKFKVAIAERIRKEKNIFLPSFFVPWKQGNYTCVLIMRNLETGKGARGRAMIKIGGDEETTKGQEGLVKLEPPLLLVPDQKTLEIHDSKAPGLPDLYGYDENSYSALTGLVPAGTRKLYAALRINQSFGQEANRVEMMAPENEKSGLEIEGGIEVKATLVAEKTGEVRRPSRDLPVSIVGGKLQGLVTKLFLEIEVGELAGGTYRLNLYVSGKGIPEAAVATTLFDVK
ncbi:MAG: VWA domain-containing protein, partial [Candidatus Saccharicenans sp.]